MRKSNGFLYFFSKKFGSRTLILFYKKMKLVKLFCIILFLTISVKKTVGQEVIWGFHPVVTVSNPLYGLVTMPVASTFCFLYRHPLIPIVKTRFIKTQKISTPQGDAEVKTIDWKFKNFALGYTIECLPDPEENSLGVRFSVNYERQNWEAKLPGSSRFIDFTRQAITPEIDLTVTLGNFTVGFVTEAGCRYNYALKANGEYNDKNYVNNGITVLYGFGFEFLSSALTFRYEHDCFDYFNQDFRAPNRTKPYKNFTTKHNYFSLNFACYGLL